jgi:hypothetical protein
LESSHNHCGKRTDHGKCSDTQAQLDEKAVSLFAGTALEAHFASLFTGQFTGLIAVRTLCVHNEVS